MSLKEVLVDRFDVTDKYTLSNTYIRHEDGRVEYIGPSIERGWNGNQNNISCVPTGTYPLKLEYSPRFKKDLWELKEVPGRAECKFHPANYARQLEGCIAIGTKFKDIDGDKIPDVTASGPTMDRFHKSMGDATEAIVIITDK
jgi:hypothetical protein